MSALKRLLPFIFIFLILQTILRISLLVRAIAEVEFSIADIASVMLRGIWFDIAAGSFLLLPVIIYHLLLPTSKHGSKLDHKIDMGLRFIYSYALLFDVVAEHLFWTEFTTRFNFIAVDYLVYTQEVIGNIVESYPLGWLLFAIGVCALIISWLSLRLQPLNLTAPQRFKVRAASFAAMLVACFILHRISNIDQSEFKDNAEATEVAANGVYNLFHAFWHNEINYAHFYAMQPDNEIAQNAHKLLNEKVEGSKFISDDGKDLTRLVTSAHEEKHKNVILVVMESLSADYMETFGNKNGLTPNLDKLSKEGLFFSNLYATGTRTVRGLEAVTLSIPPTPGQSILRRPDNENLFSLGFIFKDRGYDTKFIYGGYGYFDNMNAFFAGNGFDVLDRTKMTKEETQFANVWGICDEDMFTRAIKEADNSYASGKPFMHLIMTTSNHRPYTYPEGKIDISSHSGRLGGVKYADYSVGQLIKEAKTKPWFKDTVFIFVSDHTSGAGGKAELDPNKYHIPMIFYAPGFIKPQNYDKIASQIDFAPTLLGLLDFTYYTKFYGENLLNDHDETPHAFISNYQKVALAKDNTLTVLAPKRKVAQYSWPDVKEEKTADNQLINDTITYYQSASWWKEQYKRIPSVFNKVAALKPNIGNN
jgi:phosphoglycerol transferase MdoB-like AlkP superfamily enzyme